MLITKFFNLQTNHKRNLFNKNSHEHGRPLALARVIEQGLSIDNHSQHRLLDEQGFF
jgi:hypothetical protein